MVLWANKTQRCVNLLSVLALSSRFDGRRCTDSTSTRIYHFQYSLCRVVLMVAIRCFNNVSQFALSVLALSSRFDGL